MTHGKCTPFILSRRNFLSRSAWIAVGGLVAVGSPWSALADDGGEGQAANVLRQQLRPIAASTDFQMVRQLLANLVQDPALPALASQTLQSAGSSLTAFQTSLLQSIAIVTRDPAALAARVSGAPLTEAQRESLETVRSNLDENPAIRRLRRAGTQLKSRKSVALLQNYVGQVIANDGQSVPPVITSGNTTLDAVIRDAANARGSSAFANLAAAMAPIMQNAAFVPFLRRQEPEVLTTFLPSATAITLLLPNDVDPPLLGLTKAILELIAAAIGAIIAILAVPEELVILAFIGALAAILTALIDLQQALDCDGDPMDPADAGEC